VNLIAVFVLVGMLCSLFAKLAISKSHASLATSWRAAAVMAPALVAASVCSALVWPGLVHEACHCVAHGLHHPHLCPRHPDYAAAALVPAASVAAAWVILATPQFAGIVANVWQTSRWARQISKAPKRVLDNIPFHLIDAPGLGACTTGLLKPRIAVDRGLWGKLRDDERRAVLLHEEAHRQRRDPLTFFVLKLCAALAIPQAAKLIRHWQVDTEMECDRHAASVMGSPDSVASALLVIAQHHRDTRLITLPMGASAAGSAFEARVRTLLAGNPSPRSANLACDALAVVLFGCAASIVVSVAAGDLIHHAAETVLGLFVAHH
jgi:Zn-dependent protease with chaperone function